MTTNAQQQDSCTGVLMRRRAWMKEEWRRAVGDMGLSAEWAIHITETALLGQH